MTAVSLRPYQQAALDAVRNRFAAGDRRTLLVLPTGTGKTIVFAELARQEISAGRRVLVLAHRGELLEQARAKLEAVGVWAQLEQAEQHAGLARAVVASVQTLRGPRLRAWSPHAFDLIVIDEAHHATARSYRDIRDYFAAARILGVTATADRADGESLGTIFPSVAYRYELVDAIRDGWLAPIRARRVRVDVDLDLVNTVAGDLHEGQLAQLMSSTDAVQSVALPLIELATTRPTLVFAVTVAHAHAIAAALDRARPGSALAISGSSTPEQRAAAIRLLVTGRIQFVANAQLWTEGFDLPAISCVAIARPTKSRALFAQMVGRGTRLSPGKTDCLVLDFTGNTQRHRLISPVDLLGTDLPDGVRRRADAVLDTGDRDVLEAIDHAQRTLTAAQAPTPVTPSRERVRGWVSEEVTGLLDLGDLPPATAIWTPATAFQRSALVASGIDVPPTMSRAEAERIVAVLSRRAAAGLATFKQMRWLARQGVDARAMTKHQASAVITARIRRERGQGNASS